MSKKASNKFMKKFVKFAKTKKAGWILVAVILVVVFGFFLWSYKKDTQSQAQSQEAISEPETVQGESAEQVEKAQLSQEELEGYYAVYQNPFVIHVRKALNGYLAGTNEGIDMPEVVIEKNMEGDAATGLGSFDKSYYESKFIVMDVTDAAFGGKNIGLLFQDKPDKAFTAWVYRVPGENEGEEGYYDLRGFWENPGMLKNVEFLVEEHKELVFDKEHCL